MDNNISKAEFLRNCFKEMLDDGKPHRYRELLEFARQQIQGTRFEEKIQPNLFIQYVNSVIKKPDSDYERAQFGIYQKKSPQRKLEIKSDNELDRLYSMLDCSCALKEQMEKAYTDCCVVFPENREELAGAFKHTFESLDESINGLSAWVAYMEDLSDMIYEEADDETEVPAMQM